jgi:hypothetical protein
MVCYYHIAFNIKGKLIGASKTSPVEVQMSINALFFSSICVIMLFIIHKFFVWQNSKYHQVNPLENTWKMIKTMKISR